MFFFFQAEDGIRDSSVTGVQTCALPISSLELIDELQQRLNSSINSRLGPLRQMGSAPNGYASTPEQARIDYSGDFEWDNAMKCKMTEIFGIHSFRLCQKLCVISNRSLYTSLTFHHGLER